MELITGVATGSDMSIVFNIDFQLNGQMGEEVTNDKVWLYKSHFPIDYYKAVPGKAQKVICSVRNPIDAFISFFTLYVSHTQSKELVES